MRWVHLVASDGIRTLLEMCGHMYAVLIRCPLDRDFAILEIQSNIATSVYRCHAVSKLRQDFSIQGAPKMS